MKIAIFDGGLADQTTTDAIRTLLIEIGRQKGDEVQPFVLREQKFAYCLGCFECWTKTPGRCRIEDGGQTIAKAIIHSDLVIYLTPITFGGYSSALKMAVDRTICLISPFLTKINGEVHHRKRYAHYPNLLGIGLLPQPDAAQAALFTKLIERNAINFHAPTHASLVIDSTQAWALVQTQVQALLEKAKVPS